MATNIEIKARVRDLELVRSKVEVIADAGPEELRQEDTFFHTPNGRLKLRTFGSDRGELIAYVREDSPGPKPSHYLIAPTDRARDTMAVLAKALGIMGVVKKQRSVYIVGNTRVHLDRVEEVGTFVELEVALDGKASNEEGIGAAEKLMNTLGIHKRHMVPNAYIDLLLATQHH